MIFDKESWLDSFLKSNRINLILERMPDIKKETTLLFNRRYVSGSDDFKTYREMELAIGTLDIHAFYILDYISSLTDSSIYDIGCGINIFKSHYNVIGIDPNHRNADICRGFDEDFIREYEGKFENAISICAIHFCHVSEFRSRLIGFFNLVKPGGYGYLAINVSRIINASPGIQDTEVIDKVRKCFKNVLTTETPLGEILYFEDVIDDTEYDGVNEGINGNIRLLLKRT